MQHHSNSMVINRFLYRVGKHLPRSIIVCQEAEGLVSHDFSKVLRKPRHKRLNLNVPNLSISSPPKLHGSVKEVFKGDFPQHCVFVRVANILIVNVHLPVYNAARPDRVDRFFLVVRYINSTITYYRDHFRGIRLCLAGDFNESFLDECRCVVSATLKTVLFVILRMEAFPKCP